MTAPVRGQRDYGAMYDDLAKQGLPEDEIVKRIKAARMTDDLMVAKPDRTDQTIRNADPVNPIAAGAALAANGALLGLPNAALKMAGSHYIDKARQQLGALGTAAELGGGVASGGALGDLLASLKIAKAGQEAAQLSRGARIANAAKTGATVGGVYGATEGESLPDAAAKGVTGALTGGVAGAALSGIGEVGRFISQRHGGPLSELATKETASERLHNTAKSGGRTTQQVAADIAAQTNPDMLVADQDLSHALSLKNQGDISPKVKETAARTLRARQAQEGPRVAQEVADIAGISPADANPQIAAQTDQLHANDSQRYGGFFSANPAPVPEATTEFTALMHDNPTLGKMLEREQRKTPGRFFVHGPQGVVIPTWEGIHRAKVALGTAFEKAANGPDPFLPGLLKQTESDLLGSVAHLPSAADYDAIRAASRYERVGREASAEGAGILSSAKGDRPTEKTGGDVLREVQSLASGTPRDPANPEAVQAFRQAGASALGRDLAGVADPAASLQQADTKARVQALLANAQQGRQVDQALERSAQRKLTRDVAGGLPNDTPELTSEASPMVTHYDIKQGIRGRLGYPLATAAAHASEGAYTKHVSRPAAEMLGEVLLHPQGPVGAQKYQTLADLLEKIRTDRLRESGRNVGGLSGGVAALLANLLHQSPDQ